MAKTKLNSDSMEKKVLTLTAAQRAALPQLTSDVFHIESYKADEDIPDDDEVFPRDLNKSFTFRTVFVDSINLLDGEVIVNGSIKWPVDEENSPLRKWYSDREEAKRVCLELVELQKNKVEELERRAKGLVGFFADVLEKESM